MNASPISKTKAQLAEELKALHAKLQQYSLLLDESTDPIFNISPEGRYLYVNHEFASGVGKSVHQIIGKRLWDVFPPDEADKRFAVVRWVCENVQPKVFEVRVPLASGDRYYITSVKPIIDAGQVASVICISKEITDRKKLEQRLSELANFDSLTGVANRRHFLEQAEQELSRVRRYEAPLAIAMLDLDHFKTINDTFGHQAGDRVLKETMAVCRRSLREPDIIGRMGGEEFAILFPQTDAAAAAEVAERLLGAIAANLLPMEHGLPIRLTVSLGIAAYDSRDAGLDALLNRADNALYEAKHAGRNRVVVST